MTRNKKRLIRVIIALVAFGGLMIAFNLTPLKGFKDYADSLDDGQAISVGGAGNAGSNGGPNGNVIVNISVQHHELFERQGSDVICKLPLTFAQAALGAEIEIPTIDGRVKYNVPAGTQTDTVIRLKGKGMPIIRSSNRGDQYVKFYIDVPRHLNEKQKDLLRKFGEISGDSFENSKNFFDRVKKKFK